jgi:sulfatase maturation enzyme AslB (radical SAM superfamily)
MFESMFIPGTSDLSRMMAEENATGYVDAIVSDGDFVAVSGWALLRDGTGWRLPERILFADGRKSVGSCHCTAARPDVLKAYGITEGNHLALCGFSVRIPTGLLSISALNTLICLAEDSAGTSSVLPGLGYMPHEHPARLKGAPAQYPAPGVLEEVVLGISSKCNNRCAYCYIMHDTYSPVTMGDDMLETILTSLRNLHPRVVTFGAMGEPTLDKRFFALLERGEFSYFITSNMRKQFTKNEIGLLATLKQIVVSLDTIDPTHLRQLRPPTDVRDVVFNILRVKAHALEHGLPVPQLQCNIVMNELAANDFPHLACALVTLGFDRANICEMRPWFVDPETLPQTTKNVSDPESMKQSLRAGLKILNEHGIAVALGQSIESLINPPHLSYATIMPEVATRLCLDPWKEMIIYPDATWAPCCFLQGGKLDSSFSLEDALTGSRVARLRRELLTGNLSSDCRACINKPACSL